MILYAMIFKCLKSGRQCYSYYSTIIRGSADLSLLREGFNFAKYMNSNILNESVLEVVSTIEKSLNVMGW